MFVTEYFWNTFFDKRFKLRKRPSIIVLILERMNLCYASLADSANISKRGSERFSWRINFNKYEDKLKCDGLNTLILNNGFNDPGEFREAIAYDMYAFLGADASLYNYAVVYRNGEYFGVYLALEGVDKTFLRRNYGKDYGKLYKPELSGGGSDFVNFPIDTPFTVSDLSQRGFFMALPEKDQP